MSESACIVSMQSLAECLPRVLPSDWRVLREFGDGYAVQSRDGLRVICSTAPMADGREWLHVSMSRQDRIPSYEDMKRTKNIFVGDKLPAYQIFPPASEHVNIHQFCLHLYAPLTGGVPLPDFTCGGGTI